MRHNRLTKVTIVNFPPKKRLWPICLKIMQPCILSLALMIFLNHYSIVMWYLKQTKIIVNLFKKIPCRGNWVICVQFGPKLPQLLSHDLPVFFREIVAQCGTIDRKQQCQSIFPQNSLFKQKENLGPIWSKII